MCTMGKAIRKPREYEEARQLRRDEGLPYKRTAKAVGVSTSSAFTWTKDIPITPEQAERNLRGPRGPASPTAGARWSEQCRRRRVEWQEEGRTCARRQDPLHLAGCMLYWAEGSKSRNTAQIVNSDVSMMRFARRFFTDCFGIDQDRFAVRLNVYLGEGKTIERSSATGSTLSSFLMRCFASTSSTTCLRLAAARGEIACLTACAP